MDNKKIIIISGKQFSGKDTVASILKDYLKDFNITALADAIKIELGEEKNITFKEIERNKPLYRAELIELGNKKRAINKNYWIDRVISTPGNLIISDVRLRHELEIFRKLDAIAIRLEADRTERAKRGKLVKEDDFTETELDNQTGWDYVIKNNGTIEELQQKVSKLAEKISKELSKIKV